MIIQTFVTLAVADVADERGDTLSLLTTARITRTGLSLIGLLQSIRMQISFYHLSIVASFCHLLSLPEYLVVFMSFLREPFREVRRSKSEKILNIISCTFGVLFNLALRIAWALLGTDTLSCIDSFENTGSTI